MAKKNIIRNSNVLLATTPIFMSLAILWNEASGGLYTSWIITGGLILGVVGIWRTLLN